MSDHNAIAVSVEQLLELRHIPTPNARTLPESNGAWIGMFKSRKRGHGTDYDDLRPYCAGDDIRHIDWRASARTGDLHTRLYREEKEHRLSIVCDLRQCMFTGSQQLRATRAVILCARLLWHACKGGTRVYLRILTQTGVCSIAPGSGHSLAIRGCATLSHEYNKALQTISTQHGQRQQRTSHAAAQTRAASADVLPTSNTTDAFSEQHALPTNHPMQGPTLATLQQWLIAQAEHKATFLWITGLDYEGEQFYEMLGAQGGTDTQLMIHMDDPLLDSALRSGEYHYDSHTGKHFAQRKATINRRLQHILHKRLVDIKQLRTQCLDSLSIPLISNVLGDDAVIAQLRRQAYLA